MKCEIVFCSKTATHGTMCQEHYEATKKAAEEALERIRKWGTEEEEPPPWERKKVGK